MKIDISDSSPWVEFINKCAEFVHGSAKIITISSLFPQRIATITFGYKSFVIEFSQEIIIHTEDLINANSIAFKCQFESPDEYFFKGEKQQYL